jgi:hypothetical protein
MLAIDRSTPVLAMEAHLLTHSRHHRAPTTWSTWVWMLLCALPSWAQDLPPDAPTTAPIKESTAKPATMLPATPDVVEDNTTLEQVRTPVQAMTEHFLGSASRPVRFDWRRSFLTFGVTASELIERNNFGSNRIGAFARHAFGDIVVGAAVTYVITTPTTSSQLLSLTPYRQFGRPNHFEIDIDAAYAIVEGVVTPILGFLPPAEMALLAVAGVRYLIYPAGFVDRDLTAIGLDLVSPRLRDEVVRIERDALPGMVVDPARIHTLVGAELDVYFQPGVFLSPRAMLALPLGGLNGSGLGLWWELSLAIGYSL